MRRRHLARQGATAPPVTARLGARAGQPLYETTPVPARRCARTPHVGVASPSELPAGRSCQHVGVGSTLELPARRSCQPVGVASPSELPARRSCQHVGVGSRSALAAGRSCQHVGVASPSELPARRSWQGGHASVAEWDRHGYAAAVSSSGSNVGRGHVRGCTRPVSIPCGRAVPTGTMRFVSRA